MTHGGASTSSYHQKLKDMKLDNLYNVMWLNEVRENLCSIKAQANERLRYNHDDNDDKATAECVKSAIEDAIAKIEKAFEIL